MEKYLGGFWEFPGGKVEFGETPQTALTREIFEELNVCVSVGTPLKPSIWNDSNYLIHLQPFFCEIISGELQLLVHAELRWCFPEDFNELSWADADIPILCEITKNGRE